MSCEDDSDFIDDMVSETIEQILADPALLHSAVADARSRGCVVTPYQYLEKLGLKPTDIARVLKQLNIDE